MAYRNDALAQALFDGAQADGLQGSADVTTETWVSALLVRGLCEAVQSFGLSSMELCARSAVRLDDVEQQGGMSLEQFDRLLLNAMAMSRDDSFGLHWAERSPMFQMSLATSLFAAAPTLRDAIRALIQIQWLIVDREQCIFIESAGRSTIALNVEAPSEAGKRVLTELALGGIVRLFSYRGDEQAVRRINVDYPAPGNEAEYARLFGPRVRFAQPRTSIEFTSAVLDRPHPLGNDARFHRLTEQTAEMRQRVIAGMSVSELLEGHIRAALPRVLSMAEAAADLRVSERSLRRRLADERLRYAEIVEKIQQTRARELLLMGDKTVKEVGFAVGFASSSSFVRAYRRWTGRAPGADRTTPMKPDRTRP